jgi:hypothetical protein
MKWTEEKITKAKNLIKVGKGYREISELLGISYNSLRVKMGKLGESVKKNKVKKLKFCVECSNEIKNDGIKFCGSACSAKHNNRLRPKKNKDIVNKRKRENYSLRKKKNCVNCEIITTNKYCSSKCQAEHREKLVFDKIEGGVLSLNTRQYKKYLIEKHGNKCMECGWCEVNQTSGKVPIELEHIDGDSSNNELNNLKLLCPNCHSLTPTYKALNKGNGRHARMVRYNEGKSF